MNRYSFEMLVNKFLTKKIVIIFFLTIFYNQTLIATGNTLKKFQPENKIDTTIPNKLIDMQYLIDTGDSLFINFKNISIFSRSYMVDTDGKILLPELGTFNVRGKTIKEIESELNEKYKEFIIDPEVEIIIANYRTLNIFIGGEVNRPGLYTLNYKGKKNIQSLQGNMESLDSITSGRIKVPRLFDALQMVDGFTNKSDLSNIEITRNNSKTLGGGKIKAKVNFLNLLKNGDQSNNIRIFDGDSIFVSSSENILLDQILDTYKTNLNPRKLEVFITGNIMKPGRTILKQNTSLVEGIMAAGGKKSSSGNIVFIRLKRDGTSDRRVIKFNETAIKGSFNNPILISGDLIIINKNIIGKTTSIISEVGAPIVNAYGLYKIFD